MSKDEAMKLALEALEAGEYYIDDLEAIVYAADDLGTHEDRAKMQAAISALQEALEQPAQKCSYPYCGCNSKAWCKVERNEALDKKAENARELGLDYEPAQQEPVAWGIIASNTGRICQVELDADEVEGHNPKYIVPLYTSPPRVKSNLKQVIELYDSPEQPAQQEPVAEYIGECSDGSLVQLYDDVKKGTKFYTSPSAQQEPVAWMTPDGEIYKHECWPEHEARPLVFGDTSPPAQQDIQRLSALVRAQQITIDKLEAQRKPLTDEQLWDIYMKSPLDVDCHVTDLNRFCRAIEAAHGIKENA